MASLLKFRLLRGGTDIAQAQGAQVATATKAATPAAAAAAADGAAAGEGKRQKGPAGGDASRKPKKEEKPKAAKAKAEGKQPKAAGGKGGESKGEEKNQLGIQADKVADFPKWYQQVVKRSDLIEYYDISGCYILRPGAYSIWETIQKWLDGEIKKLGVKNSYFPLFISEKALNTEKAHVEGFAAEVAWVTHSGESELEERIAVRPTSETIMYPAYAKWIRSHRDLPLKLNQWANVVRWEFKKPTPFIRSREFLWQEGHTAFATKKEADVEVLDILGLYERVYQDLLAVPVVRGRKTEVEKFAGGDYTTTVEAFVDVVGRGIQGATSHGLGQNFAKMFKIEFEDEKGERQKVWQNSWGLTTRTIGVMVMVHSDNRGLVLPPRVAPTQVVIVPILDKKKGDPTVVIERSKQIMRELESKGVRVELDLRDKNPGWKYSDWDLHGVPLRIEIGARDVEARTCILARRDYEEKTNGAATPGHKTTVPWSNLTASVIALLDDIQSSLYTKARATRDARMKRPTNWTEFLAALDAKCMALSPHCNVTTCEEAIKHKSGEAAKAQFAEEEAKAKARAAQARAEGRTEDLDEEEAALGDKLTGAAKSLCIPFDQPALAAGTRCIHCDQPAVHYTLFGRSY